MTSLIKAGRRNAPVIEVLPEKTVIEKPQDGIKEVSNIVTTPSRTTVVDFSKIPKRHLLQYSEGSPWPVTYLRGIKGLNDPKKLFDVTNTNPDQQYERINGQVMRVNSALTWSQDATTKEFTVSGEATLVNTVIPNEGDIFVADIGDARKAIFNVNETTRLAYNKIATYRITYTMLFELTPEMQATIDTCTIRDLYYVSDRAWVSEDTLLTKEEYETFIQVNDSIDLIQETYTREYYNELVRTLTAPKQPWLIYDIFLMEFVRMIGIANDPTQLVGIYPHPPYRHQNINTLYTAIINQSPGMLKRAKKNISCHNVRTFATGQNMNTIRYSNLDGTLFFDEELRYPSYPLPFNTIPDVPAIFKDFKGSSLKDVPFFTTMTLKPYVLTETFYEGGYSSVLEYGLGCFLRREPLRKDIAIALAESLDQLDPVNAFYYTPLVYVLLKYAR